MAGELRFDEVSVERLPADNLGPLGELSSLTLFDVSGVTSITSLISNSQTLPASLNGFLHIHRDQEISTNLFTSRLANLFHVTLCEIELMSYLFESSELGL